MISVDDRGPPPPCPRQMNLAAEVLQAGSREPGRTALEVLSADRAESWTYARLIAAVRGTGAGLRAMGLGPGDRILMRIGNRVEFPILFLGAIAAGLVPVPTSAQLTVREITAMARQVSPALIVAEEGVALPDGTTPVLLLGLDRLRSFFDGPPCDWEMGAPDRLAYLIFTSGSSGTPRAVAHAHRAILARRMMWQGWYGAGPTDRLLHAGAFNWTYTLGTGLMDPWAMGATALIPAGAAPGDLFALLDRAKATLFAAAPGVFRQMLRDGGRRLPRLRHALSAGEHLSDGVRAAWRSATGTEIHPALGMSEVSTFVSGSPAHPAPGGSSGYVQPGRRIAVLDEGGAPVPRGTPGVLAVDRRDPGLFLGYDGAPEETAARFQGDWFLTGDMVEMGPDGAITYLGRCDDMMNAGGFRVSPLEVEAALAQHPGIAEVAAIELAVRADVTVIAAVYVASAPLPEAELAAFAETRLARYKQPRVYIHADSLPRGANNKVLRRALRARYAKDAP
ncbi:class I adenylate-forming enzyme family protein [Halodurantibacterium flavum]|uniref:Class I adenylate-forming enzyme family protein n=1 Tax=Halodurantibacterium flavum TaxID=1382802 RepID=A0ABW4S3C9_9RHOB